jgi:hypothetical protein
MRSWARHCGKIERMFLDIKFNAELGVKHVQLICPHPCSLINLDTLTEEEFRRILRGHN